MKAFGLLGSSILAIPSLCTCGMALSTHVFTIRRKHFLHIFLIRFILSMALATIALISTQDFSQLMLVLITSMISLIGAIRVSKLLQTESQALSLNEKLLQTKLQDDE